jgi:hypothetical protein
MYYEDAVVTTIGGIRLPDRMKARRLAGRLDPQYPVCLDVECWDIRTASDAEVAEHVEKLILILGWMKDVNPELMIGYYGIIPIINHGPALIGDHHPYTERLRRQNERVEPLMQAVDIYYPIAYTYYDDFEKWSKVTEWGIDRVSGRGKPVYPFIWPRYYTSLSGRDGEMVEPEIWEKQLQFLHRRSDGVVIWTGLSDHWDDEHKNGWAKVTGDLIRIMRQSESALLD